jgi:hypothetical protein
MPTPTKPAQVTPGKSVQVKIKNTLPQSIRLAVTDASGKPQELVLGPYETSEKLDQNALTQHTNTLAQRGHIRIRTA